MHVKTTADTSIVYEDVRIFFKTLCGCTVDLEDLLLDCSATGALLMTGTVVYSNSEGNITSSTLVDMLQVWLLTSTNPVIILNQQSFKLNAQCPPKLNSLSEHSCDNLVVSSALDLDNLVTSASNLESSEPAVIGGSFIGGVVTGLFMCVAALCIGLW